MFDICTLNSVIGHILSLTLANFKDSSLVWIQDVSLGNGTNYVFLYDDEVVLSVVLDECTSIMKLLSMHMEMSCTSIFTEHLLRILLKVYLLLAKLDCTSEDFMSLTSFSKVSDFVESTDFSVASIREYIFEQNTCRLAHKDAEAITRSYGMEGDKK